MEYNTIALLSQFKSQISEILRLTKEELENFFDDGLHNYLNKQKQNLLISKTFLFRVENVNFFDVYFPQKLRYVFGNSHNTINFSKLLTINSGYNFSKCVIIGEGGSGKSMLFKAMFLYCINKNYRVPILIELRHLNSFEGTITEYIYSKILQNRINPSKKILERVLNKGGFVFLLDGYDEVYSKKLQSLSNGLLDFIEKYDRNQFIITSRPGTNIENHENLYVFNIEQLNKTDIKDFVTKQTDTIGDKVLGKKIINTLSEKNNEDYLEFLSSPLLLSMFIFTFRINPEIPKTKSKFYSNVFETLFTQHNSIVKRGGFQHEKRSGLKQEDIEKVLKWFSYISYLDGRFSFDDNFLKSSLEKIKSKIFLKFDINDFVYDLTTSISVLIIDGLEYKFPHRSMQEYFSALLIRDLDDITKSKIYESFITKQLVITTDNFYNFWSLCLEMDENAFKKFFIKKHLEKLYEVFDKTTPVESFLSSINFSFNLITQQKSNSTKASEIQVNIIGYDKAEIVIRDLNFPYLGFISFIWKKYLNYNKPSHPFFEILSSMKTHEFIPLFTENEEEENNLIDLKTRPKVIISLDLFKTNRKVFIKSKIKKNIEKFFSNLNSIYKKNDLDIMDNTNSIKDLLFSD
ncbi:MAG: NACHT domain-containing protein [bacterium]